MRRDWHCTACNVRGTQAVSAKQLTRGWAVLFLLWANTSLVAANPLLFHTSDRCMACHNRLSRSNGEDVSIGIDWRTSLMANSARDPYWQASVRREVTDHPEAQQLIEDECAICHMPMARYLAHQAGKHAPVFAALPASPHRAGEPLAMDGVSCTLCHQISDQKLGSRESFIGGFVIDSPNGHRNRRIYGPFEVDRGLAMVMRSSTGGFEPTRSEHIGRSELCATCHTLITQTLSRTGQVIGEFPEQVPYLEWLQSAFRDSASCQSCHMPLVQEPMPISSVLGPPREGLSRHTFVGGNFFMQRLLGRFALELSVPVPPQEFAVAATRTERFLQEASARLCLGEIQLAGKELKVTVRVENLAGHKLPTAYPSRRVWIRLQVRNQYGQVVFDSGAWDEQGKILGNDNDADPSRFEPHYQEITRPDQVAIYEAILGTVEGEVTTGLLFAHHYLKDNRLLPRGFDKYRASKETAVVGQAMDDPDFTGGSDGVLYRIAVSPQEGPFEIRAELWYQPIAYRWAENLAIYPAQEPQRFVRMYRAMAPVSAIKLAEATGLAKVGSPQ